ncbi:hypothetical protein B0I35DRAFT_429075 [Stachybotrys elegans]|uniref:Uncharacterized protein n=1 Tax=Stachybotrys elegans TaxID=80388 RepID=A0A8K0SV86_9HYPO|nr:hypothetical protein B0I35DRAFT_429075 [Stachybotrys elegans]
MQYHSANPPANDAEFHFLSCPGAFLCDIWKTQGPALLHLTTELLDDEVDAVSRPVIPGHLPVTARLINFPITQNLPLSPGVFPSMLNQLRSITFNAEAWKLFPPYSELDQVMAQFYDFVDVLEKKYPRTYGRMAKAEEFLYEPLGRNTPLYYSVPAVRIISLMVSWAVYRAGDEVVRMTLGYYY